MRGSEPISKMAFLFSYSLDYWKGCSVKRQFCIYGSAGRGNAAAVPALREITRERTQVRNPIVRFRNYDGVW